MCDCNCENDYYHYAGSVSHMEDQFYELQQMHDQMQQQLLDLANEVSGSEIGDWYKKRILAILEGDKWREVD